VNHELVRATEEHFGGQVPAHLAAQAALNGDGLKREFLDAGWNVAAALLAGHLEGFAACGRWEHGNIIGE
jgi:hypothetical protein